MKWLLLVWVILACIVVLIGEDGCATVKAIRGDAVAVHRYIDHMDKRRQETHQVFIEWWQENMVGTKALVPTILAWWLRERWHRKKEGA